MAATFEFQPLDNNILEYEILPRLPVKSICRFKSVSKHWKLFLSSHMFGKMHHQIHQINNKSYKLLLLDKKPHVDYSEPLNHGAITVGFNPLKEADPRFDMVLASLDGLVCVASSKTIISLALWNPSTGAYYKLPSNPNFERPYDPTLDAIGFYSDSSNDYKLLYLVNKGSSGTYIYSQRLNTWRKIKFAIENNYGNKFYFCTCFPWATFCDQSLYFLVRRDYIFDQCIICFDENTQYVRAIEFPPLPRRDSRLKDIDSYLVIIDGCIHLCVIDYWAASREGNVWKLNGDRATWVKVRFAPYAYFSIAWPPSIYITRNARDSCFAILKGGFDDSFQIISMEEFAAASIEYWPLLSLSTYI